jgi:hypothetical protein
VLEAQQLELQQIQSLETLVLRLPKKVRLKVKINKSASS